MKLESLVNMVQQNVDLIGMSTLLTTKMTNIDETIIVLRNAGLWDKIMIGGTSSTVVLRRFFDLSK